MAEDAGDEHAGFDGDAGGRGPADILGAAFLAPRANGGFEAVNGDDAGESILGGGCLDEAEEFVGGDSAVSGIGSTTRKVVATTIRVGLFLIVPLSLLGFTC